MKKRIYSLLGISIAFMVILSSCGLTDIEQAQEDYNYNNIIPEILGGGIKGDATAIKTNTKTYSLNYFRGGSTWTWNVTGATGSPVEGGNGNEVEVFFNQSSDEIGGPVMITVFETTQGGKVSETDTFEVTVSPFVISVSGPDLAPATGAWVSTFSTPHDAGATYAWSVIGAGATVTDNNDGTVDITWDLTATNIDDVGVRCVKTYLGLESVADTAMIDLWGFSTKTIADFVGTYSGTEDGGSVTTFTTAAGVEADELVFEVDAGGMPALYESVYVGWGEYFEAGYGNDGDVILTVNLTTGAITIDLQDWGVTNWGLGEDPIYHYMIDGEGFFAADNSIYLEYNFRGNTGGLWYTWDAIFTKQ